jgi:hypothetical protein
MSEDRVDCLVNRLHVTCLTLIRLKKESVYGQDPGFLELLGGYLRHSRQLMDLIRDREAIGNLPGRACSPPCEVMSQRAYSTEAGVTEAFPGETRRREGPGGGVGSRNASP